MLINGIGLANDKINVTGANTERIRSDHVDWWVDVLHIGPSQQLSYQSLQPSEQSTVAFLKVQGIQPAEFPLGTLKSEKEKRDPHSGAIYSTSWTTTQPVQVSRNVASRIQALVARIGALISQGMSLSN